MMGLTRGRVVGRRDRGFTMIELLVVVIVIGVLAAIAIPVYLNQRKKGIDASLKSDLHSASVAYETWLADNGGSADVALNLNGVVTPGTGPFLTFTPSPGNVVRVRSWGGGITFCIHAYNAGASLAVDATRTFQYQQRGGGLLASSVTTPVPDNAACP